MDTPVLADKQILTFCTDSGCHLRDLLRAMTDRDEPRERGRERER